MDLEREWREGIEQLKFDPATCRYCRERFVPTGPADDECLECRQMLIDYDRAQTRPDPEVRRRREAKGYADGWAEYQLRGRLARAPDTGDRDYDEGYAAALIEAREHYR